MASPGIHDPTWAGRRAENALRRVRADGARHNKPCCLCQGEIDYSLRYPHPMSCSVQHVKPRAHYPELTWDPSNWAPAHLQCNVRAPRGADSIPRRSADLDLGAVSGW